jgi:hypothetical protein
MAMLSDEFERNPVCTHLNPSVGSALSFVAFGRPWGLRLNVSQDCVLTVDVYKFNGKKNEACANPRPYSKNKFRELR